MMNFNSDTCSVSQIRSLEEIKERKQSVIDRLKLIDELIEAHLKLPFFERSKDYMSFIDLEKRIHMNILDELKWLLNE